MKLVFKKEQDKGIQYSRDCCDEMGMMQAVQLGLHIISRDRRWILIIR